MTFAPPTASGIATRRLGLANGLLWIVAAIVLVVVASTTAYGFVVSPYTGGNGFVGANGNPWDLDDPVEAVEVEPNVWQADGSAVIRIPAADFTEPRVASLAAGEEIDLYRTADEDLGASADDYFYPDLLGFLYDDREVVVVPTGQDVELWVRSNGRFQLELATMDDVVEIDGDYGGTGNALLMYRGDAVSARFVHTGSGIFFVDLYTQRGQSSQSIIDNGEVSERLSWDDDTWVIIVIESSPDRGRWTIEFDEPVRSTPTPGPTPTPTETDR